MRRSLITLGLSVVMLVSAGTAYSLAYYWLTKSTAELTVLEQKVNAETVQVERIKRAQEGVSGGLTSDEELVQHYFLNKQELVPFLEHLQNTGKILGSTLQVNTITETKVDSRTRIQLAFTVTGSFDAVMRTLGALEFAPYDGVLTGLNLSTSNAGTASSTVHGWSAVGTLSLATPLASSTPSTTQKP